MWWLFGVFVTTVILCARMDKDDAPFEKKDTDTPDTCPDCGGAMHLLPHQDNGVKEALFGCEKCGYYQDRTGTINGWDDK